MNNPHNLNTSGKGIPTIYKKNRANPFIPGGGATMWNVNEISLKNRSLRERAGVSTLDHGITVMYAVNSTNKSTC